MKIGFVVAMGMVMFAGSATQATESEIELLSTDAESNETRVVVDSARTDIDGNDVAVDELLKIASFEDEGLRLAALEVMVEFDTPRARAALGIVLYKNDMATVRAAAADKLGAIGDGETIYTLALALETEKDPEVRAVIEANIERNLEIEADIVASRGTHRISM